MTLTERQREILLELIKASTLPGAALDEIFNLKLAIANAEIEDESVR